MIANAQSKSVPARLTTLPLLPHTCFLCRPLTFNLDSFCEKNYLIYCFTNTFIKWRKNGVIKTPFKFGLFSTKYNLAIILYI